MIEVLIKKQGVVTNKGVFQTDEAANAWIQQNSVSGSFGKQDRWIHQDDLGFNGEVKENATAVEVVGSVDEEKSRYFFPAEFTVEKNDISEKLQQEEINNEALKVLANTDWYVIRFAETGVVIPQVVIEARANARAAIVRG